MAQKKSTIDTGLIRELAEMLNDTNLGEIEVEEGELRIRVAKNGVAVSAPAAMPAPMATSVAPSAAPVSVDQTASAAPAAGTHVPSPMVGTAYMAAAPGAKPFVTEGQKVKEGETIVIVEAMKTMNQIPAPRDGVVAAVSVEDGQPVEFGETLIILE